MASRRGDEHGDEDDRHRAQVGDEGPPCALAGSRCGGSDERQEMAIDGHGVSLSTWWRTGSLST